MCYVNPDAGRIPSNIVSHEMQVRRGTQIFDVMQEEKSYKGYVFDKELYEATEVSFDIEESMFCVHMRDIF